MHAESLDIHRVNSEPVTGSFVTPSDHPGDLRFVWGGDTVGQGWGISPSHGGMTIYRTMMDQQPAFFVHSGDTIYADGPLPAQQKAPDGSVWRNVVTEEKSKVAESLDEFRGNYRYNLLDEHLRAFNHQVPQVWQWDDHEVTNNWSDSKDLSANVLYREKNVALLTARATRAFLEYAPMRLHGDAERDRVYRRLSHGPMLDLLMIDMRSYRGPNSSNLQTNYDRDAHILGPVQLAWIKRNLKSSTATWKVICADMPIGLQVGDGRNPNGDALWEAVANGAPGRPLGRELEIANLLAFIREEGIRNIVWLTADVHYCAAHHYSPDRAAFKNFDPFWEFVAGPLHAGAFGPNNPDPTFGLDVVFQKAPDTQNQPPSDENQFFGQVDIEGQSGVMTVRLRDRSATTVYSQTLYPV
jgi:alkaline phosphatase D